MRNIKLMKKRKIFLLVLSCFLNLTFALAQSDKTPVKQVTGRVSDENGELLIGVAVTEIGTTNGTLTDLNGTYTLKLMSNSSTLKFTYLGFKEALVEVGRKNVIDIALEENMELLDEVVVVGFGSQKKASVVGSISNIKPDLLMSSPTRSITNNLAGKLAGVIAVQRSGNPALNNSDFWIRGMSTFTGNNKPLVLIDGIERSMNDMDPNEIESFSVLKDAAASAVYGVRGANGVIMITTKRGKIGAPKVSAKVERVYTKPTKIPEYVGSVKHLEILNEAYTDMYPSMPPRYSDAMIENYRNNTDPELYPDINWWDVITNDYAESITASVDVSGGSDILRYAVTLGLYNENGIIDRDKSQAWDSSLKVRRYNVRSNVDINLTKSTLLRFNLGGNLLTRNSPPEIDQSNYGIFQKAMQIPPYIHPPIYSTGDIPKVYAKQNPWAFATQRGYEKYNRTNLESMASLEQDLSFLTKGLKVKGIFSFDRYSGASIIRSKNPAYSRVAEKRDAAGNLIIEHLSDGQQFLGFDKSAEWGELSTYFELNLNYERTFAQKHAVNSMLLYNQRELQRGTYDWDKLPYRTQGLAGRFSYTYDTRYVAEFNFGYNGSENFAKGNRYGFFPSGSLGWIVSQEKFMEGLSSIISNLKIRGSIGLVGNSILGRNIWTNRFAYLSTIATTDGYTFGTESNFWRMGRLEGNIGSPNLTWETSTKMNLGIDLGLFNNAVSYTIDFFKDDRKDIFMQRTTVPSSAGFAQVPYANFGKVTNKGIEMSLSVNKWLSNDWHISALANFTYAHNEITEYDEAELLKGTNRARTGHPVGQLFGLVDDGLFTSDDFDAAGNLINSIPTHTFSDVRPGDIKYKDMNGDGIIDAMDQTAIGGTFSPEVVYGFGANLKYKDIDFGFFFQGVGKSYRIIGGENWLPASGVGAAGNIFTNVDDRWTETNQSQDVFWPRLYYGSHSNNEQASTWWLRDMSFLRLKSLELGYSLPKKWINTVGLENMRLFARGSNLLTFSDFKLWDPELDAANGVRYPMNKSFSFGFSINFR